MQLRDSEGYILLPQEPTEAQIYKDILANSQVIKSVVTVQERLSTLYAFTIDFFEERLFNPKTLQFVRKYLLYPFLSGVLSASLATYRLRRSVLKNGIA